MGTTWSHQVGGTIACCFPLPLPLPLVAGCWLLVGALCRHCGASEWRGV